MATVLRGLGNRKGLWSGKFDSVANQFREMSHRRDALGALVAK